MLWVKCTSVVKVEKTVWLMWIVNDAVTVTVSVEVSVFVMVLVLSLRFWRGGMGVDEGEVVGSEVWGKDGRSFIVVQQTASRGGLLAFASDGVR